MITLSVIGRVSQLLRNLSVFRENCSSCSASERLADLREAQIAVGLKKVSSWAIEATLTNFHPNCAMFERTMHAAPHGAEGAKIVPE
jgi:hypothetical protein